MNFQVSNLPPAKRRKEKRAIPSWSILTYTTHFNVPIVSAGHSESLKVTFIPDQSISAGKISLVVEKFNKALITQEMNLCTDVGLTCPLQASVKAVASIAQEIPGTAPAIKAVAHIVVTNGENDQLSCIDAPIQVVKAEDGSSHIIAPSSNVLDKEAEDGDKKEKGNDDEDTREKQGSSSSSSIIDQALLRGSSGMATGITSTSRRQ